MIVKAFSRTVGITVSLLKDICSTVCNKMAVICLTTINVYYIYTEDLFQLRSCVCMWILVSLAVTKVNILKRAVGAQCISCSMNILFGVTPVLLWRKCLCHNFDTTPLAFFFTNSFLCVTVPTSLYFRGKSSHVSSSPGCEWRFWILHYYKSTYRSFSCFV